MADQPKSPEPCPLCGGPKRHDGSYVEGWRVQYHGPEGHWLWYGGRRWRGPDVCWDCWVRHCKNNPGMIQDRKAAAFQALADGYTQAEAGEMVGVTRQTVNVWVAAKRKKLRAAGF